MHKPKAAGDVLMDVPNEREIMGRRTVIVAMIAEHRSRRRETHAEATSWEDKAGGRVRGGR